MITVDQFNTIVTKLREGKLSQRTIARQLRVGRGTVSGINNGRNPRQNGSSLKHETLGTVKTGRCPECKTPYPKDVTDCVVCAARAAKDMVPGYLDAADDAEPRLEPLPQLRNGAEARRAEIRLHPKGSRRGIRHGPRLKDVPAMRQLVGSVTFQEALGGESLVAFCVPAIE